MSTAAAFLECDPPDECPPTDTQTLSSGGKSKDESKSEKVNNTNIIDKVKATNIPSGDALKPGSFGISPEGAQQALTNRINQGIESTGIPSNLQEGSFSISEAGAEQALTNRVNRGIESTGIPANLPEGAFTVTPKKKFNVPKKDNTGLSFSEYRGISNRIEYVDPLVGEANPKFKTFEIGRPYVPPAIEKEYGEDEINLTRSFENSDSPLFKRKLLERINNRRTSLNKPPYLPLTSSQLQRGVKLKISD